MQTFAHRRQLLFGAFALAVAAAGCSSTKTLNAGDVEREITKGISAQIGVKAKISCPTDVEPEKGGTFTCSAKDEAGHELPVAVTQRDASGNVHWNVKALNITSVESTLTRMVSDQVGAVTVDCPAIFVASAAGSVLECQVTDPQGRTGRVVATAKDSQGTLSWALNP